jgi:hypothetical protein
MTNFTFIMVGGFMGKFRRVTARIPEILLLSGSLAVSLAMGEAVLRVYAPLVRQPFLVSEYVENEQGKFCVYDPKLGWIGKPDMDSDYSALDCRHRVRQNKYGFRGTEHSFLRTSKKRIVALGDSFTWGFGVEDAEIFTSVLERESDPPVEIVNLGVTGYGTDQEYLLWRSLGVRFRPDEVLLTIVPENDVWNNVWGVMSGYPKPVFQFMKQGGYRILNQPVPLSETDHWRPYGLPTWLTERGGSIISQRHVLARVAAHSALVSSIITALARNDGLRLWLTRRHILSIPDPDWFWEPSMHTAPPHPVTLAHWDTLFRLIGLLHSDVLKNGAKLRVLIVPESFQVYPDLWEQFKLAKTLPPGARWDRDATNRRITAYCREHGIPVTDPLPALREAAKTNLFLYYPWNGHWTAAGHRLVARQLRCGMSPGQCRRN